MAKPVQQPHLKPHKLRETEGLKRLHKQHHCFLSCGPVIFVITCKHVSRMRGLHRTLISSQQAIGRHQSSSPRQSLTGLNCQLKTQIAH